jgi:large subunit ribosomal protein L28
MSRVCVLTGKSSMVGNRVSHANNKTKVRLMSNLQNKRIFVPSLKKYVSMRISTEAIRTINKIGIEMFAAKQGLKLK